MKKFFLFLAGILVAGVAGTSGVVSGLSDRYTDSWRLAADGVTATVYNAVPEQCNADFRHTASMFTLNLDDVLSHRIIAMERTMMKSFGFHYGDIVRIEGASSWDGIWQIQDTMNRRYAGTKRIDILVPNDIRTGLWKDVRIYVPANRLTRNKALEYIGMPAGLPLR